MISPAQNGFPADRVRSAEETLRQIAGLPAPEGLAERVNARLRTAPRSSGIFHWPIVPVMGYRLQSPLLRGAMAAAIVCLVAGGGWQICSRVPSTSAANDWVQPARVGNSGSFSNAGAMRTPDTLNRPVLPNPVPAANDLHVFNVEDAKRNAAKLGSNQVMVSGHFWWGKEGSMIFDSGYKATLAVRYSDEFNARHSLRELVNESRKADVVTITGRFHLEPTGRLTLIADDIRFAAIETRPLAHR